MDCGKLDKKIMFQKTPPKEKNFTDYYSCHAQVNVAGGDEYLIGGGDQGRSSIIFTVRYCSELKDLYLHPQRYKIIYDGASYDIQDSEDYMMQHIFYRIKATGKPL